MGLTVNLQKVNSILMLLFMFVGMIMFIIKLTVGYVKKVEIFAFVGSSKDRKIYA